MIANPVEAVTAADPYPYYDDLATRSLAWDAGLGMWIASRAADVEAVLGHPWARVRAADAAVPPSLEATPAGDVFARLVRMNDRADRKAIKDALIYVLTAIDAGAIADAADVVTAHLTVAARCDGGFVDRWITDFPIAVVAHLAGITPSDLPVAIAAARDIGACFGPVPPTGAGRTATRAAATLAVLVTEVVSIRTDGVAASLANALGVDRAADATSNVIGLLFQTVDATAGLAGNTVVRLTRDPATRDEPLAAVVADVASTDPSVHNTRRFFAERAEIGGVAVEAGDTVLVVLAAANRDPARAESLSFGAGAHRCPAGAIAPGIADLTVSRLLDAWPGVLTSIRHNGYRPLPNVRIPRFGEASARGSARA